MGGLEAGAGRGELASPTTSAVHAASSAEMSPSMCFRSSFSASWYEIGGGGGGRDKDGHGRVYLCLPYWGNASSTAVRAQSQRTPRQLPTTAFSTTKKGSPLQRRRGFRTCGGRGRMPQRCGRLFTTTCGGRGRMPQRWGRLPNLFGYIGLSFRGEARDLSSRARGPGWPRRPAARTPCAGPACAPRRATPAGRSRTPR